MTTTTAAATVALAGRISEFDAHVAVVHRQGGPTPLTAAERDAIRRYNDEVTALVDCFDQVDADSLRDLDDQDAGYGRRHAVARRQLRTTARRHGSVLLADLRSGWPAPRDDWRPDDAA